MTHTLENCTRTVLVATEAKDSSYLGWDGFVNLICIRTSYDQRTQATRPKLCHSQGQAPVLNKFFPFCMSAACCCPHCHNAEPKPNESYTMRANKHFDLLLLSTQYGPPCRNGCFYSSQASGEQGRGSWERYRKAAGRRFKRGIFKQQR